jgi:hypothetical protein
MYMFYIGKKLCCRWCQLCMKNAYFYLEEWIDINAFRNHTHTLGKSISFMHSESCAVYLTLTLSLKFILWIDRSHGDRRDRMQYIYMFFLIKLAFSAFMLSAHCIAVECQREWVRVLHKKILKMNFLSLTLSGALCNCRVSNYTSNQALYVFEIYWREMESDWGRGRVSEKFNNLNDYFHHHTTLECFILFFTHSFNRFQVQMWIKIFNGERESKKEEIFESALIS